MHLRRGSRSPSRCPLNDWKQMQAVRSEDFNASKVSKHHIHSSTGQNRSHDCYIRPFVSSFLTAPPIKVKRWHWLQYKHFSPTITPSKTLCLPRPFAFQQPPSSLDSKCFYKTRSNKACLIKRRIIHKGFQQTITSVFIRHQPPHHHSLCGHLHFTTAIRPVYLAGSTMLGKGRLLRSLPCPAKGLWSTAVHTFWRPTQVSGLVFVAHIVY